MSLLFRERESIIRAMDNIEAITKGTEEFNRGFLVAYETHRLSKLAFAILNGLDPIKTEGKVIAGISILERGGRVRGYEKESVAVANRYLLSLNQAGGIVPFLSTLKLTSQEILEASWGKE